MMSLPCHNLKLPPTARSLLLSADGLLALSHLLLNLRVLLLWLLRLEGERLGVPLQLERVEDEERTPPRYVFVGEIKRVFIGPVL